MDDDETFKPEFSWRRAPVLLADRLGIRPAGLLGGLLAVAAAACGAWWALRPPPPPAEEVLPFVQTISPALTVSDDAASTTIPAIVVVHVDGAVFHPGIHELRVGSRVADAIDAAGGLTFDADRQALNLAQVLSDGQRVWVPQIGEEVRTAAAVIATDGDRADADAVVALRERFIGVAVLAPPMHRVPGGRSVPNEVGVAGVVVELVGEGSSVGLAVRVAG